MKKNKEVMEHAACQDKEMPHRMHESRPFGPIKENSDGIAQSPKKEQEESLKAHQFHQRLDGEEYGPPHQKIEEQ